MVNINVFFNARNSGDFLWLLYVIIWLMMVMSQNVRPI